MTKEDLVKLGLDEATAAKVETASTEELKSYVPKTQYDEAVEAKKTLDSQIKARDKQLEDLKKATGDAEALKGEIAKLQEANKAAKVEYEERLKQMQIDHAVEKALTGAGAKNLKAVRALLDLDKAELDGETVKGLDAQIKALREAEDAKFLFAEKETAPQIFGMTPPASGDDPSQGAAASAGAQFAALYNAQVAPAQTK